MQFHYSDMKDYPSCYVMLLFTLFLGRLEARVFAPPETLSCQASLHGLQAIQGDVKDGGKIQKV